MVAQWIRRTNRSKGYEKFVLGSFGQEYTLLTEGSCRSVCYEIIIREVPVYGIGRSSDYQVAPSLTDYQRYFHHKSSDRGYKDVEDVSITTICTASTAYG